MQRYRLTLAITWLAGGGIVVLTVIMQATLGHYGSEAREAWAWLFPNLFPTLTLVLGITGLTKAGDVADPDATRKLFIIAMAASLFYLLVLAMPIFLQPFVAGDPVDALRQANLWLGPLQGVVSTLLGVFFTRESPKAGR